MSEQTITTSPAIGQSVARQGAFRRMLANPMGLTALVVLGVIILVAVFGPLLLWNDPGHARLDQVNSSPNAGYLLGGDSAGRDILSRLVAGSRITVLGGVVSAAVAAVIGVSFGLAAGYKGRSLDLTVGWISDLVMVLPSTIVLVAMFTITGPNAVLVMLILGVMLAPSFFRLTRSLVVQVRGNLYVDAAKVSALPDTRIVGRHILAVIRGPLILHFVLMTSVSIILQAGFQFIGLGDPNVPTWGSMLQDAFRSIYLSDTAFVWPGLAIAVTVMALLLVGNALRDALDDVDPKAHQARKRAAAAAKAQRSTVPARPLSGAILQVDDLVVGYDQADGEIKKVVDGVSFELNAGEVVGLVGESGSGKTQTALSILKLLPTGGRVVEGRICLDGQDLGGLDEDAMTAIRGVRVAYVPQEPMSNLDPTAKIGSQLAEPIRVRLKVSRKEAAERALSLLEQVNIKDPQRVFDSYPHEISGGMAQRVLIAGAVSCDPDVIIADEPTTALDVTVQAEILDILRNLQAQRNLAVLLVTHNFGVVADLCDRVVVMQNGKVAETGDVRRIFAEPEHPYTRTLMAAMLDGRPSRRERTEVTA
jgi:peptide/nickel transport system permease protein